MSEDNLPEIEGVFTVTQTEQSENTDPFAKSITNAKDIAGVSPTFKRRITRDLNKRREGASGVETKQLNEELTGYDRFQVITPPHQMETLVRIYEMSVPHYAAVGAKVSNIVGLGFHLEENDKAKEKLEELEEDAEGLKKARRKLNRIKSRILRHVDSWNVDETFTEVLIKVWTDYEVTGNGYIEIGRTKSGDVGYFGHIPAHTMRVRRDRDGFVQMVSNKAQFFVNYGDKKKVNPVGEGVPNEVIHLKNYSPSSTYYGVPDVIAAEQQVAGNEFAARYNLDYFENKAVPRYVITLKGATLGASAQQDLLAFFQTSLKGQNHRSIFIPLPNGTKENPVEFDMDAIETKIQDSSFNQYHVANNNGIMMAHRVPVTKVSVSAGGNVSVALARDADKTFKEQVCSPRQKILEKKINRVFKEFTSAFDFRLNEMTLTDEDTQSKIDERYRKVGVVTGNQVRNRKGWASHPDGDTLVDLNKPTGSDRARDDTRSNNATDSDGEARNPKGEGRTSGTE